MNDTLTQAVRTALNVIADFAPKFVLFVVILIVGVLVAKALSRLIHRLLTRVGFERAAERGGIGRALHGTQTDASGILAKLVYYAVVLFALQLAFNVFGPNGVSVLLTQIIAFLPRLFVAVVIVVVVAAIASAVKALVSSSLGGLSYGPTLAKAAAAFILALGVIAALNQVGIATTVTAPILIAVLATGAGILVVGVGGGLVRPMQDRWEGWLQTAEREGSTLRHRETDQSIDHSYGTTSTNSRMS